RMMASSRSALPGPMAISSPQWICTLTLRAGGWVMPSAGALPYAAPRQALAAMGRRQVNRRADGYDAVQRHVAQAVIAALDVVELHGAGNAGPLRQLAQIARESGIVCDVPQVAVERAMIGDVEAHERGEESPVRLCAIFAGQVSMGGEMGVQRV